jgi:hypothetical protein
MGIGLPAAGVTSGPPGSRGAVSLRLDLDATSRSLLEDVRSRDRLSRLLLMDGELHADATVSPQMAEVLRALRVDGSPVAEIDRAVLALIDTRAGPHERDALAKAFEPFTTPEAAAQARDFYARLDALADEFSPAQTEALRLMMVQLQARGERA